jgi:hypothetical protein
MLIGGSNKMTWLIIVVIDFVIPVFLVDINQLYNIVPLHLILIL